MRSPLTGAYPGPVGWAAIRPIVRAPSCGWSGFRLLRLVASRVLDSAAMSEGEPTQAGTATAVAALRAQGLRMTPQRLAILEEIMSAPGYVIPLRVIERS